MSRILPDDDDVIVWKLDEANLPFANSSTSPDSLGTAVDVITKQGVIVNRVPGPFPGSRGLGILTHVDSQASTNVPATASSPWDLVSTASGSGTNVPAPITISGWVRFNTLNVNSPTVQFLLVKRYQTATWASPYTAFDFKVTNATGTFRFAVTTSGRNETSTQDTTLPVPVGVWCHVGLTYDSSYLKGYINGVLVAQASATGLVDYGSDGPWSFGAPPGGSERSEPACHLHDWRVAQIARPDSYFRQMYRSAPKL